jgi:hypothetical protein
VVTVLDLRPRIAPCSVKRAIALVKEHHRHLEDVQGGLFAVRIVVGTVDAGVAIAGNPPRTWQGKGVVVITRCALDESRPPLPHVNRHSEEHRADGAVAMAYGALCRAAKALGYREAWTYTLPEEPGTSLRAAGFEDMGMTAGGEHDRPSRRRRPAKRPEPKRRWRRVLRTD